MWGVVAAAFACLCLPGGSAPADPPAPIPHFGEAAAWSLNNDGGHPSEIAQEPWGIRIKCKDAPPHWSNYTLNIAVPANAIALNIPITRHSAAPSASMYLWLIEEDGDAWVQPLLISGKILGETPSGTYSLNIPISAFKFEARGPGSRNMLSTTRLMLGCNFADLDVSAGAATWVLRSGAETETLPTVAKLHLPSIASHSRGRVAIFDASPLPADVKVGHTPAGLATGLKAAGFETAILRAGDLANADILNTTHFDLVVLPCGPLFPEAARQTFSAYLKAGGSFLSTDGYTFDRPVRWVGSQWVDAGVGVTAADVGAAPAVASGPLNARSGSPGDAVTFRPDQIGVFDPGFPLQAVQSVRPSPAFGALGNPPLVAQGVSGYSAVGLIGDNSAVFPPVYRKWVPVLEARDAHNTLRGAALSIMHNFAGVYRGSSWGFSGLTSGTPLLQGSPQNARLLSAVADVLIQKCYLHSPKTEYASYRRGERVKFQVMLANNSSRPRQLVLRMEAQGKLVYRQRVSLPANSDVPMGIDFILQSSSLLCPIRAVLDKSADHPIPDTAETAVAVLDAPAPVQPFKVAWRNNMLEVDGSRHLICGANQTGTIFYSEHETPAVWDQDFASMAAHGVRVLRVLHFSPFAKDGYAGNGKHSSLDLSNRPQRLRRQVAAIALLARKHRIALVLTLHDWLEIALTDEELAAQRDWCQFWAAECRKYPWVLFDVQNEPAVDVPDTPTVHALWKAFLIQKYGSTMLAASDWGTSADAFEHLRHKSTGWADVRSADEKRFEAELLNRWVKASVDGIRAGNPAAIALVGYLPSMSPADKLIGTRYTDISNMHYYGPIEEFPLEFKLIDRRFEGKGLSLGEFGAQEQHDARSAGRDGLNTEVCVQRFQQTLHYAAGMGAAFTAVWDWKELDEMVFPWGLVQRQGGVPKPWLATIQQEQRLLSTAHVQAQVPSLYLIVPDQNRIGPHFNEINNALHRAVSLLMDCYVDFGVVNEESLDRLPAGARALVWPIPFCPADATFNALLKRVKAGCRLLVTGEFALGPDRHTRLGSRFEALGLSQQPFVAPFSGAPIAEKPAVQTVGVGDGKVTWVLDPIELRSAATENDLLLYRLFILQTGVHPPTAIAWEPDVRMFRQDLADGGQLWSFVRPTTAPTGLNSVRMSLNGLDISLQPGGCAFVITARSGAVRAVESDSNVILNDTEIAGADGHFALVSQDGLPLATSHRILVLPHLNSKVRILGRLRSYRAELFRQDGQSVGAASAGSGITFLPGETAILHAPGH